MHLSFYFLSSQLLEAYQFLWLSDPFLGISDALAYCNRHTQPDWLVTQQSCDQNTRGLCLLDLELALSVAPQASQLLATCMTILLATPKERNQFVTALSNVGTSNSSEESITDTSSSTYGQRRSRPGTSRVLLTSVKPLPYQSWERRLATRVESWYRVLWDRGKGRLLSTTRRLGLPAHFFRVCGTRVSPLEQNRFHELSVYQRIQIFHALCENTLRVFDNLRHSLDKSADWDAARPVTLGTDLFEDVVYVHFPGMLDGENATRCRVYRLHRIRSDPVDIHEGDHPSVTLSVPSPEPDLSKSDSVTVADSSNTNTVVSQELSSADFNGEATSELTKSAAFSHPARGRRPNRGKRSRLLSRRGGSRRSETGGSKAESELEQHNLLVAEWGLPVPGPVGRLPNWLDPSLARSVCRRWFGIVQRMEAEYATAATAASSNEEVEKPKSGRKIVTTSSSATTSAVRLADTSLLDELASYPILSLGRGRVNAVGLCCGSKRGRGRGRGRGVSSNSCSSVSTTPFLGFAKLDDAQVEKMLANEPALTPSPLATLNGLSQRYLSLQHGRGFALSNRAGSKSGLESRNSSTVDLEHLPAADIEGGEPEERRSRSASSSSSSRSASVQSSRAGSANPDSGRLQKAPKQEQPLNDEDTEMTEEQNPESVTGDADSPNEEQDALRRSDLPSKNPNGPTKEDMNSQNKRSDTGLTDNTLESNKSDDVHTLGLEECVGNLKTPRSPTSKPVENIQMPKKKEPVENISSQNTFKSEYQDVKSTDLNNSSSCVSHTPPKEGSTPKQSAESLSVHQPDKIKNPLAAEQSKCPDSINETKQTGTIKSTEPVETSGQPNSEDDDVKDDGAEDEPVEDLITEPSKDDFMLVAQDKIQLDTLIGRLRSVLRVAKAQLAKMEDEMPVSQSNATEQLSSSDSISVVGSPCSLGTCPSDSDSSLSSVSSNVLGTRSDSQGPVKPKRRARSKQVLRTNDNPDPRRKRYETAISAMKELISNLQTLYKTNAPTHLACEDAKQLVRLRLRKDVESWTVKENKRLQEITKKNVNSPLSETSDPITQQADLAKERAERLQRREQLRSRNLDDSDSDSQSAAWMVHDSTPSGGNETASHPPEFSPIRSGTWPVNPKLPILRISKDTGKPLQPQLRPAQSTALTNTVIPELHSAHSGSGDGGPLSPPAASGCLSRPIKSPSVLPASISEATRIRYRLMPPVYTVRPQTACYPAAAVRPNCGFPMSSIPNGAPTPHASISTPHTPPTKPLTSPSTTPTRKVYRVSDYLFTDDAMPVRLEPNGTLHPLPVESVPANLRQVARQMIARYKQQQQQQQQSSQSQVPKQIQPQNPNTATTTSATQKCVTVTMGRSTP
ncbi:Bromodomain testis-specific protein [Fasciola hepatica]|uniref:Bromodomain testis-specific protein n=1 Tax=Fasciola hepatica TaxID=6192 RepID=A0A4E0RJY8_FASHE|nr:Bromodomain testis-specific protein [Fasciola hepatica]